MKRDVTSIEMSRRLIDLITVILADLYPSPVHVYEGQCWTWRVHISEALNVLVSVRGYIR